MSSVSFSLVQDYAGFDSRFLCRIWDQDAQEYFAMCNFPALHIGVEDTACKHVVEQCTALRDKNNRLIFEHDLVLFSGVLMAVEYKITSGRWVLRYVETDHPHYGEIMSFAAPEDNGFSKNEYLVVGNIHEGLQDE